MPRLAADFPAQVCVHVRELTQPPAEQRLPLFVLYSRKSRLVVIEGMPDYDELRELLRSLARDSGAP